MYEIFFWGNAVVLSKEFAEIYFADKRFFGDFGDADDAEADDYVD